MSPVATKFVLQVWQEGTAELHMAGLYHNVQATGWIQLIGLREKLQETPMIFMGKSMVSG